MDMFVGSGTRIPGRPHNLNFGLVCYSGKVDMIFTNLNGSTFALNSQSVNNDMQKRISIVSMGEHSKRNL